MTRNWPIFASISILLWSTLAFLGTRLAAVPPFFLLGGTLLIGSLPGVREYKTWFQNRRVLAFGVTGIFGYHFCLFMAFRLAPPVEANLINYLWPIFVVLFSPLFFETCRLRANHVLGGMLALTGAAIAVTGGKIHFEASGWLGYLLAFFAALTWSFYSLMTKKLPPFPTAWVGGFCFVSGLLALVLHTVTEPSVHLSAPDAWILLFLGLGPMGIAFYTWDRAVKDGDPRILGGLSYLTPLLSSLVLLGMGHRPLTGPVALAIVLIIGGAALGSLDRSVSKA